MVVFLSALLLCSMLGTGCGKVVQENAPPCDCYVTSGASSAYYTHHRFFDFRYLRNDSALYDHEPVDVSDGQNQSEDVWQQGYLNSTAFADNWDILTWGREPSPKHPIRYRHSAQNVYIRTNEDDASMTHLTLRTHRSADFSTTAEIKLLQPQLFHSSICVRFRVRGASGAVAGLFTYLNDENESDIEILTRDAPDRIRYTNQVSKDVNGRMVEGAATKASLPRGAVWTEWNTHRMDWTPGLSVWYVNDLFVLDKSIGVPQLPSYLILNLWSDGGSWSHNMTVGASAYLEIQWIDLAFNISEPTAGNATSGLGTGSASCLTLCSIDTVQQPGFPKVISQGRAAVSIPVTRTLLVSICATPLILMALSV